MFSFAQGANKVYTSALSVTYEVAFVSDSESVPYYTVTRNANCSYQYLNMTESGAVDSAVVKLRKYTRSYSVLGQNGAGGVPSVVQVDCCLSEITPIRESGDSWTLDVKVIERDVKVTTSAPTAASIAAMFVTENARDYDAEEDGIVITSATKSSSGIVLAFALTGSVTTSSIVIKHESAGVWTKSDGGTWSGNSVTFGPDTQAYMQASKIAAWYGPISSNIVNIGG